MSPKRCLFCREDSSSSVSVEHIVPESLGNTTMVLPRGFVCDRCNNYFARKVEGPFLNSPAMLALRHLEAVGNKRGRIPGMDVVLDNGMPGRLERYPRLPIPFSLQVDASDLARLGPDTATWPRGAMFASPEKPPTTRDVARFVAKAGLEHLVHRNLGFPEGLESIFGAPELELCRRFARYGAGPKEWGVRVERIYDSNHLFEENLPNYQRVWEMDLLIPSDRESALFAMSIFGLEFAINLVDPDLSPYDRWRRMAKASSLLYPEGLPPDLRPSQ
ncbi:HNH endonuclease [Nocardioides sp. HDW12B]|jgi:hypothetical protein|uniref:HNH endonuclease n=1 Tax=Nocardioides sp. HDW12B TaxID=2714939 RepID=UPI0023F70D99|nr:HNH endonuclease [Nocardioides sp. HDW12B]